MLVRTLAEPSRLRSVMPPLEPRASVSLARLMTKAFAMLSLRASPVLLAAVRLRQEPQMSKPKLLTQPLGQ
jgi:hypothetical protein